jgi:hypothetical protein
MAVNGPTFCADGIFGEPQVQKIGQATIVTFLMVFLSGVPR